MEEKVRVQISSVYFRRIVLHIQGTFSGSGGLQAEFVREGGGQRLFPQTQTYEDGKFSLTLNMLSAENENPVHSGIYYLEFTDSQGKRYRAYAEDGLCLEEGKMLPELEFGEPGKKYFHSSSRLDLDTGEFYLDVTYTLPPPRPSLARRMLQAVQCRLGGLKQRLFHGYVGFFSHHKKRTGNTILFCSASRGEIGGNEKFVRDRMVERGLDQQFTFRYDFVSGINVKRSLWKFFRLGYWLATSDIIILDDYYPQIYVIDFPPDVKVVQAWHACGAFKTVGLERMGKPGAPELDTRIHKNYTHVPVSSMHSALHNAEAFGLNLDKFYPIGVPRTDIFFNEAYRQEACRQMYEAFPAAKTAKKVYLYAPTFRGVNARDAWFPFDKVDLRRWGDFCRRTQSVLLVKMHPFVPQKVEIPAEYADCIFDAADLREVNDLLFIVDVLVTDYSSIIYEFSLLHRPMYFYAFDQKMYEASRDFYEPFDQIIPGKAIKTFDGLMEALEKENFDYDELDRFVEKNFACPDGKATDRFIDELILS